MSDPVANSVIVARGLEKTYPGPPSVRALGPVDLVITAGDYLAVRGPSGSGKSALLNLLGLLDTPTGGSLHVAGVDTASLTENDRTALRGRCIGFVFQDFQLLSTQTAVENVALGLLYLGGKNADRLREARMALDRVGLAHRADTLPMTLSGGERQRVAIARALVGGPDLLLCDEPTGNLDTENSERILDLIDHLHSAGATVVVITHDESTAARARRSVVIRDGLLETHHG